MALSRARRAALGVIVVLAGLPGARPSADDLASVAEEVRRTLPREVLERLETSPPLVFRGVPPRGAVIYRERVNGVVLIASTNAVRASATRAAMAGCSPSTETDSRRVRKSARRRSDSSAWVRLAQVKFNCLR